VKVGGLIVIAGGKEDGVQSLRKRMEGFGLEIEHMPKYHGVALWFGRPADVSEVVSKFSKPSVRVDGRFLAAAGMFSHDRVDDGSELLASRLPTDFTGDVADFGAGWGYLSVELAERSPGVSRLDLYEANHATLEAAKGNMAENCPDVPARFFWHDLASEPVKDRYDLIIMNPPFHDGGREDRDLGVAFIATASRLLRTGGVCWLVANRHLPYEAPLSKAFSRFDVRHDGGGYKVIEARR